MIMNKIELSAVEGGDTPVRTDFEKLGENAATFVRSAFSVVSDLMDEFEKEGVASVEAGAPPSGEERNFLRLMGWTLPFRNGFDEP
jgi:hypothetical protein